MVCKFRFQTKKLPVALPSITNIKGILTASLGEFVAMKEGQDTNDHEKRFHCGISGSSPVARNAVPPSPPVDRRGEGALLEFPGCFVGI